jgi:uncharacterized protein YjiS (DUF1127 family)
MTQCVKTSSNDVCGSMPRSLSAERPVRGFMPALVAAVDAGLERVVDTLFAWQQRRADRLRLQSMDDYMLQDIGLSRADIEVEASKPFWRS